MDRHKIKPDSKAFNLVRIKKRNKNLITRVGQQKATLLYYSVLVTKAIDDGSKQAHHIRAFYAGCLLPRRATANTGVSTYFYNFII